MQITVQNLIPIPLKENILKRNSDVWNKHLLFSDKERVKIKAPSGTGKTTLIHVLYKMRTDYEGSVEYNNHNLKNITGDGLAQYRQQKLSIIFQDLRLFENLTARENIELNRIMQQPYHPAERIDEMAERLHITHILEQRAGLCSYGEQQRIAIVRALIQPFELLLMDEPFSHLDIENTQRAAALIAEECDRREAGFILTDLDEDNNFSYTQYLNL